MENLTTTTGTATGRSALPAVAIAAIGAIAVNLIVLTIGTAAGAEMVAAPGGEPQSVDARAVVVATLIPFVAGALLLRLVAGRWAGARRALSWVGLAVGVLSTAAPLTLSVDLATGITLAAMHVAAGVAWFVAVARSR